MTDIPPPADVFIQWAPFTPVIAEPARTAEMVVSVAPDGGAITLLFNAFTAGCGSGTPPSPVGAPESRTQSATLTGVLTAVLPNDIDWYATRGDVRGFAGALNGGQAVVSVTIGAGGRVEVYQANPQGDGIDGDFDLTIFSPGGSARVTRDAPQGRLDLAVGAPPQGGLVERQGHEVVEVTPLVLSLTLTAACPSDAAEVLATIDSIDLSLWTMHR